MPEQLGDVLDVHALTLQQRGHLMPHVMNPDPLDPGPLAAKAAFDAERTSRGLADRF